MRLEGWPRLPWFETRSFAVLLTMRDYFSTHFCAPRPPRTISSESSACNSRSSASRNTLIGRGQTTGRRAMDDPCPDRRIEILRF